MVLYYKAVCLFYSLSTNCFLLIYSIVDCRIDRKQKNTLIKTQPHTFGVKFEKKKKMLIISIEMEEKNLSLYCIYLYRELNLTNKFCVYQLLVFIRVKKEYFCFIFDIKVDQEHYLPKYIRYIELLNCKNKLLNTRFPVIKSGVCCI